MAFALPVGSAQADASCTGTCKQRVKQRVLVEHYQRIWANTPAAARNHLRSIAWCESTNNEEAVSVGGAYRGLLQFDLLTWQEAGGSGDPAQASRWEQWARGARLYMMAGPGRWPVCQFR